MNNNKIDCYTLKSVHLSLFLIMIHHFKAFVNKKCKFKNKNSYDTKLPASEFRLRVRYQNINGLHIRRKICGAFAELRAVAKHDLFVGTLHYIPPQLVFRLGVVRYDSGAAYGMA